MDPAPANGSITRLIIHDFFNTSPCDPIQWTVDDTSYFLEWMNERFKFDNAEEESSSMMNHTGADPIALEYGSITRGVFIDSFYFNNATLPCDPMKWTVDDVRLCIGWIDESFKLYNADKSSLMNQTGADLISLGTALNTVPVYGGILCELFEKQLEKKDKCNHRCHYRRVLDDFQTKYSYVPCDPNKWTMYHTSKCIEWIVNTFSFILSDDIDKLRNVTGHDLVAYGKGVRCLSKQYEFGDILFELLQLQLIKTKQCNHRNHYTSFFVDFKCILNIKYAATYDSHEWNSTVVSDCVDWMYLTFKFEEYITLQNIKLQEYSGSDILQKRSDMKTLYGLPGVILWELVDFYHRRFGNKSAALWKFLLSLLLDKDQSYSDTIKFVNADQKDDWQFHIIDTTKLSVLWRREKNRITTTRDTITRKLLLYEKGKFCSRNNLQRIIIRTLNGKGSYQFFRKELLAEYSADYKDIRSKIAEQSARVS